MTTAFDIIGGNKALQEHWIKRLLAIIIDALVVLLPLYLIQILWSDILGWWWFSWLMWGLFFFIYSVILELAAQASIGKKVLNLKVVTTSGQPLNVGQMTIRNLFKIIWPFIWLDVLLGMFTDGDPRQKYMDRVANVTVTRTDAQAYVEEQFRQMQYVPPHPQVSPQAWGQPVPGQQPGQQQPSPQPPTQGATPQQQQTWTPVQSSQTGWPQHQWDEKGELRPPVRFCSSCGGQLAPRGDGKMACVRCGLVF